MIRVNLAKGQGKASAAGAAGKPVLDAADLESVRKLAINRFMLIILGPLGLFVYEQQSIPPMLTKIAAIQRELEVVTAKNAKAKDSVEQMKKFKKEQELLQSQIGSIESLKKDRLREVKILDYLQKDIPGKLWLTAMELDSSRLMLRGIATTDSELTEFMDSLSRSIYLKEVSLVRSAETSSKDLGTVKQFEIKCATEKAQ